MKEVRSDQEENDKRSDLLTFFTYEKIFNTLVRELHI